jgi:hypothetical protein
VKVQVLVAASMKMRALWNAAPFSLVGVERRYIPEGSRLQKLHSFFSSSNIILKNTS